MDKYLTMFSAQLDAAFDGLTIKTVNTSDIRIKKQDIYFIHNKAPQITLLVGWINRLALVIIYAWFGFFKIIDLSPAEGLVTELHRATFMHYIPIHIFLITLGIAECFIGVLWLFPKLTKTAFIIFILHVITTFLPLFFFRAKLF